MKAWHDAMDSGAKRRPEQSGGKPKRKYHMLKIAFANLGGMILKKFPEDDHDIFSRLAIEFKSYVTGVARISPVLYQHLIFHWDIIP